MLAEVRGESRSGVVHGYLQRLNNQLQKSLCSLILLVSELLDPLLTTDRLSQNY